MRFIITIAIAFGIIQFLDVKAELNISLSKIDVTTDPEYFKDVEAYIEDEGKGNKLFINFTLIKSLRRNIENNYKFMGKYYGRYTVFNDESFQMKLCDIVRDTINGHLIYKALGLDEKVCPTTPGVYGGRHIDLINKVIMPETLPPDYYLVSLRAPPIGKKLYEVEIYFRVH